MSPLYLNQNELTCWNVCELIAIILEHITVVLNEQGLLPARRRDPWDCFAQVCLVRSCSVCVSFFLFSFSPYCSALYDNVVVNRVYSELALGWTSKPSWTPSSSLGFIRTGLVAVLCKCIVLSYLANIEKKSLSPLQSPLPLSISESQLSSHGSAFPSWLSHCALLPSVRI